MNKFIKVKTQSKQQQQKTTQLGLFFLNVFSCHGDRMMRFSFPGVFLSLCLSLSVSLTVNFHTSTQSLHCLVISNILPVKISIYWRKNSAVLVKHTSCYFVWLAAETFWTEATGQSSIITIGHLLEWLVICWKFIEILTVKIVIYMHCPCK